MLNFLRSRSLLGCATCLLASIACLPVVDNSLAAADGAVVAKTVQAGTAFELACPGGVVFLEPGDVVVQLQAPEGWAGVADRNTQVVIDARITEDLKLEGLAREVIRHVQELRKQANLEMEDRIILHLETEAPELRKAIDRHRSYIAAETLTQEWAEKPLGERAAGAQVKIPRSCFGPTLGPLASEIQ